MLRVKADRKSSEVSGCIILAHTQSMCACECVCVASNLCEYDILWHFWHTLSEQ